MATFASRRLPGWAFGALVVLTSLITAISLTSLWLHNTVLDTDKFVDRIGPVIDDPAVEAALGNRVAAELVALVNVDGFFENVLPDRGEILAPVLTNAVEGFLAEQATQFFASDQFQEFWTAALTRAHEAAIKVLEGGGENVSTQDGRVVLNLIPMINQILADIGERVSGLVGSDITLPEIDPSAPPSEARQRLETALGVEIPDDFGQIVVFESDTLETVQVAVDWFDKGVIVLIVLSVILLAITIALAPDRRRGVMWIAIGVAAVTVLLRRFVFATEDEIMSKVKVEANRDAVNAVVDQIFSSYLDATITLIVISLLVWLVAFTFGPSRPAQAVRGAGDADWIREHVSLLRIGVVAVAAGLVLFSDLSFLGLLIVGVVVGLIEVWLGVLSRRGEPPAATAPAS